MHLCLFNQGAVITHIFVLKVCQAECQKNADWQRWPTVCLKAILTNSRLSFKMYSSHQNVQDDLTKNSFTHPASTEPYFQYALAMVL